MFCKDSLDDSKCITDGRLTEENPCYAYKYKSEKNSRETNEFA